MNVLARISTAQVTEKMIKDFLNEYLANSNIENHTLGLREKEGYIEMYIEKNSDSVNEDNENE